MMKTPTTSVDVPRQSQMTSTSLEQSDSTIQFFNLKEVADILRVTPSSIYRLVEKRALNFYRVSRKLLFKKSDIVEFVERNKTLEVTPAVYEDVQNKG